MKAMFSGGPYSGETMHLPTAPGDTSYLTIGDKGRYDRIGTNEVGIAMFEWVEAVEA